MGHAWCSIQLCQHGVPCPQPRVNAEFLVDRSWRSTRLAVALHWALLIDCEERASAPRIAAMQTRLYTNLKHHNPDGHDAITGQMRFKALLDRFGKEARPPPQACMHVAGHRKGGQRWPEARTNATDIPQVGAGDVSSVREVSARDPHLLRLLAAAARGASLHGSGGQRWWSVCADGAASQQLQAAAR